LRPERADIAFVVHLRGIRPAPCRLLQEGPTPSRAGFLPQAIQPVPPQVAPQNTDQKDASHQLLQPTPQTSTLRTVRFSSALGKPYDLPVVLSCPRPMTSNSPSSRASLDGDAPALASQRHPRGGVQSRSPDASSSEDPTRAWWSFDRCSSALGLPVTALSTAHRARRLASDVLCRSHPSEPDLRQARDTPPDPTSPAASSKTADLVEPGRLPSTGATSSASAYAEPPSKLGLHLAWMRARNHRQLDTGSRCFHLGPAFSALSPPKHKAGWPGPGEFLGELATRREWNT
jgi:hypothetical protein